MYTQLSYIGSENASVKVYATDGGGLGVHLNDYPNNVTIHVNPSMMESFMASLTSALKQIASHKEEEKEGSEK